jgi:ABC-type phosphate/phosphonate transport system substrate-binding protein
MTRKRLLFTCALLPLLFALPAAAAPREIVIANENLVRSGPYLEENLDRFLRRLEVVAGWPARSQKGKAFTRPADALEHIRKHRTPFAILPIHQFVQARKELKLEPIGRANGFEGAKCSYWGIAKAPAPFGTLMDAKGKRLALTEISDPIWVRVLLDGNAEPSDFQLVEVKTGQEAIDAVAAKRADAALLYEADYKAIEDRVGPDKEFAFVHVSGAFPPSPVVAVGKFAKKADTKKLAAALDKTCKEAAGNEACARVGIQFIESGRAESYQRLISYYESAAQ